MSDVQYKMMAKVIVVIVNIILSPFSNTNPYLRYRSSITNNYILDVFEMLCKLMHIMYVAADMTPDQKPHILAWQSVLTNDIQGLEARTF